MCAIIIATSQRNSAKKEYMCMYIPLVVLCLSSYWIGCCRKYNCTRETLIRNILLQMMAAMSYPQLAEAEETLRWSYRNPFSQQTSEALKAFFFYRCSAQALGTLPLFSEACNKMQIHPSIGRGISMATQHSDVS